MYTIYNVYQYYIPSDQVPLDRGGNFCISSSREASPLRQRPPCQHSPWRVGGWRAEERPVGESSGASNRTNMDQWLYNAVYSGPKIDRTVDPHVEHVLDAASIYLRRTTKKSKWDQPGKPSPTRRNWMFPPLGSQASHIGFYTF